MDNTIGVLGTSDERSEYDIKLQKQFNCGSSVEKFKITPTSTCPPCPPRPPCPVCPPCPPQKSK